MKPFISGTVLLLAAIAALLVGCDMATLGYASRVIDAGDGTLIVEDANSAAQTTHEVAPDAEVTRDGQPVALEALEPGDKVDVETTQVGETEVVTEVHAKSAQAEQPLAPQPMEPGPAIPEQAPLFQSPLSPQEPQEHQEHQEPQEPQPVPEGAGADSEADSDLQQQRRAPESL